MLASPTLPETTAAPAPAAATDILITARWPVGGIRTHLGYNYPALRVAGYRCTVVVPDDGHLPALRETLPDAEIVPVPVRGRDCVLWRSLRPLVRSGKYAFLHAHGMTAAAHAAAACLGSRVPLAVTLHEPFRPAQFPGIKGQLKRWLIGRVLARARALIAVGEDARDNLLRTFPNLRRGRGLIRTVHNGIDTARFAVPLPDEQCTLRDELGIDDETMLLGYLGRFMPEKGFPLLIEAVARLARCGGVPPFHVVAYGSSDYRKEYTRRIRQEGLDEVITLRDFVPDVRPVLEQLDLVVVPSLWEASPLVPREAMAAGVPVLGADCQGLREVLRDTPSRTFQAGDAAALEVALRQALADPWFDEASAFAAVAVERYDNRHAARRLLEIYDELCPRGELSDVA